MKLSILGERKKENRAKRLAFRGRYVVDIHFKQLRCAFTITLYWPAKQFIPKAGERQLPLQKADRRELWCWERSDWLTAGSVASTRPCVNVCNQPCPFRDHTRGEAETVAAKIRKIAYANHYISIFDRHFFSFFKERFWVRWPSSALLNRVLTIRQELLPRDRGDCHYPGWAVISASWWDVSAREDSRRRNFSQAVAPCRLFSM